MRILSGIALALALIPWSSTISPGSTGPQSISAVVAGCTPVIKLEYQGDKSPWGQCIALTKSFVDALLGPPVGTDDPSKVSGDLAYELTQLYEDGTDCKKWDTELPVAIQIAATLSQDVDQRKLILQISQTIESCQAVETGTISPPQVAEISPD